MNAASDGLGLAGDLLIVCLILSVGIVVGKMSNQMGRATSTVINQNTIEYLEADISSLLASKHTGASVKQYVTKYRRTMLVEIETIKSDKAGVNPLSIDAKTSIKELSDESSAYYIDNAAQFSCTAKKDSNGNYRELIFKQSGAVTHPALPQEIKTADEAKNYLSSLFSTNSLNWYQIALNVKDTVEDSTDAKSKLVQLVNSYGQQNTITKDSDWSAVTAGVGSLLEDYKGSLDATVTTEQHHRDAFAVDRSGEYELEFVPTTIIVVNDANSKVYVWSSEHGAGWITSRPDVGISDKVIVNNSATTSISVVAYN